MESRLSHVVVGIAQFGMEQDHRVLMGLAKDLFEKQLGPPAMALG